MESSIPQTNKTFNIRKLKQTQKNRSVDFFKTSRVESCAWVRQNQQDPPQAIPYFENGRIPPYQPSTYRESFSHHCLKPKSSMRVGMKTKPLTLYNPDSYRNRLPIIWDNLYSCTTKCTQVQIGGQEPYAKQFNTTYNTTYGNFGRLSKVSNTGIQSFQTKWHHHLQAK